MTPSVAYGLVVGVAALILSGAVEPKDQHQDFHLFFNTAGLGSEMGTLQPTLKVEGDHFNYTLEQNSHYGTRTLESQDVCSGTLRAASVDSIIELAKSVGDTLVYRTDPHVSSGAISELVVKSKDVSVHFTLHNDSHPVADKIIAILNSNLPADKQRLYIVDPK
ncbi:MAG: hypothetical protein WEC15_04240 [Flavobacteriales bacterium]